MRIFALINQKGGCAKTTTAVNLSACLAHRGKRVLLIDLDPQGHASLALGISPEEITRGMASVLTQETAIEEVLIKERYPGLDLAPSNLRLAAFEQQLSGLPQREERLLWALRQLQGNYDLIFIDAPPSLGLLSFNALRVADEVLVPVDPSSFSVHGLSRLLETLDLLQAQTGQAIGVRAVVTLFSRTRFSHEMLQMLNICFTEPVAQRFRGGRYRAVIRANVRLREAARHGIPIIFYDSNAIGAQDYEALAQEILEGEEAITQLVRQAALRSPPGPCFLAGGVLFTWIGSDEVAIAGDFNDWVPDRKIYSICADHPGEARVQKWLPFVPTRSAYKLRINGVWREDPFSQCTEASPFGGRNSLLEVKHSIAVSPLTERSPAAADEWSMAKTGDPN